jgi:hypothetical protein
MEGLLFHLPEGRRVFSGSKIRHPTHSLRASLLILNLSLGFIFPSYLRLPRHLPVQECWPLLYLLDPRSIAAGQCRLTRSVMWRLINLELCSHSCAGI